MNEYICLDSSVLIKIFVPEQLSDEAIILMQKIIESQKLIVLPSFAWAELGSILRKKCNRKEIKTAEADSLWLELTRFPGIHYLDNESIIGRSWKISRDLALPTLYDSAFLAVAEIISENTGSLCEFWTADERLLKLVKSSKQYVRHLRDL